jgi:hypothetical protein
LKTRQYDFPLLIDIHGFIGISMAYRENIGIFKSIGKYREKIGT